MLGMVKSLKRDVIHVWKESSVPSTHKDLESNKVVQGLTSSTRGLFEHD